MAQAMSKDECIKEIETLEREEEVRNLGQEKSTCLRELRTLIREIYKREEIKWRQRTHSKWLKEGDANTDFFLQNSEYEKKGKYYSHTDINGRNPH